MRIYIDNDFKCHTSNGDGLADVAAEPSEVK